MLQSSFSKIIRLRPLPCEGSGAGTGHIVLCSPLIGPCNYYSSCSVSVVPSVFPAPRHSQSVPLQGMFLCILLKSHSSFRLSSNSTIPVVPSLLLMVRDNYPWHFRIKSDFKGHIFHCAMLRSHLQHLRRLLCSVCLNICSKTHHLLR